MEFGLLKSKIETKLVESYKKSSFNSEIKTFKKLVLEDKNISKIFYLYDELSKEKGFEKSFADDYLEECVDLYSRVTVNPKSIKLLESWVNGIQCENNYKDIDTVLSKNTFIVENIINAKNNIISNLTNKKSVNETINVPLDKMVEVANDTLKNYLSTISESDLKEIKKYSSWSTDELNSRYNFLSEMVVEKLEKMIDDSDFETKTKINETIDRIKKDNVDTISYLKLKSLNEGL